jgi:NADPH oxidase
LTKKLDVDTANNIVLNSVGADRDPLTELRSRTNFGRPNFRHLFKGLHDGIVNGTYMPNLDRDNLPLTSKATKRVTGVGVYFCGPGAAAREIKAACQDSTSKEVHFNFWKEHF